MIRIETFALDGNPLLAPRKPSFLYSLSGDENLEKAEIVLVKGKNLTEPLNVYTSSSYSGRAYYKGPSLLPREEYTVRLVVDGASGGHDEKEASFLLAPTPRDFKGRYIGTALLGDGPLSIRKRLDPFPEDDPLVRAIAYVAGVGYHEVYVNGEKVGTDRLAPSQSDYSKRVYFKAYDLAPHLNGQGDVFGVLLANGWFGSKCVNLLIELRFASGKKRSYYSTCNGNWWFATSPIVESSIYGGETIDYREGRPGDFTKQDVEAGYHKGWFGSIYAYGPSGTLMPDPLPPIEDNGHYPLQILSKSSNVTVYDALYNLAGHVAMKVRGTRGSKITLRFAEALDEGGNIDQTNLRNARAADTFILAGEGIEELEPHFTFHGFRYVKMEVEGEVDVLEAYAVHVHSSLEKVGQVDIADEKLQRLHDILIRTEENNEQSVFSDCPQRDERFGWLNDLSTRLYYLNYDFDASSYLGKVALDIADTANKRGEIADTAPYFTGGQPADTTSLSFLLLGKFLIKEYGDTEKVRPLYPAFKKWVEALLRRSHGYRMDYYYYADWVRPDGLKSLQANPRVVSSFFLNWHLATLSELAGKLGKSGDERRYARMASESRAALRKSYLKKGLFGNGSVTETAMALTLSLYDEEERDRAYAHMKELVVLDGYHLNCGNQGYRHAFYQLAAHGDLDIAFKILVNPEYPGWGYMLENGATTVWERWEKAVLATMNSFDHPMFGCYDALFYRYLAGLEVIDIEKGEGVFDPTPLKEAIPFKVSLKTRKGSIEVRSDDVDPHVRTYHIGVPYGISLYVPKLNKWLLAGEHEIAFNVE